MALLITLLLGVFFIFGIAVVRYAKNGEKIEHYSIGVALGAMLGIAFLDIIPEIMEMIVPKQIYLPIIGIIIGFAILVILDRFIPEHEEDDDDYTEENMVHIGMISSIAIILHNIIEGMAVYSMSVNSISGGLMLMLGIGLHNIPMGMFIYSTLKSKSGIKKQIFITLSILSTFIGGLIMSILEAYITTTFDGVLYGIALGMIGYIVIMELFPYIKRNSAKKTSVICAIIGLLIVLMSVFME